MCVRSRRWIFGILVYLGQIATATTTTNTTTTSTTIDSEYVNGKDDKPYVCLLFSGMLGCRGHLAEFFPRRIVQHSVHQPSRLYGRQSASIRGRGILCRPTVVVGVQSG